MSNVRCRENARSTARMAFRTSSAQGRIQCAPLSQRGRVRTDFKSRLGWAVRPLAAGEPLVAHPQHTPLLAWAARPLAGSSPLVAHGTKQPNAASGACGGHSTHPKAQAGPPMIQPIGPQRRALRIRAEPKPGLSSHRLCSPCRHQCYASGAKQAIFPAGRPSAPKSVFYRSAPNHSIKRTATGKPASAAYVKR
jgi:hypothetical protein